MYTHQIIGILCFAISAALCALNVYRARKIHQRMRVALMYLTRGDKHHEAALTALRNGDESAFLHHDAKRIECNIQAQRAINQ
jgi:hypothetical protein